MHYLDEAHMLIFLVQLIIIIGCTRGLGEVFRRWNQPALTAEILVGIVLGPSILGRLMPELQQMLFPPEAIQQAMLDTVAWIGVLFLLLETGLEMDFSIAWRQRGSAFLIAISDIIIPMAIAFAAVVFLPDRYLVDPDKRIIFAFFMATVMTISAMPVAASVMNSLKVLKTDLGFLVMSALTVNDIIGWVLFTVILGIFTSATVSFGSIGFVMASTVGFAVLALTVGRRLSTVLFDTVKRRKFPEPATSLTITVLLGLIFGAFTQMLGIHALFGFFIAGVVAGEAKSLGEQTRGVISQMVHSLFVPLFFANIGLKVDFFSDFNFLIVAMMCIVGVGGRYFGAWAGVTWSRTPVINRDLIAIAHTPGGMMEVVVALLAMDAGLITSSIFVAIVFSAVFSSIIMGPWLSRSMSRRAKVTPAQFLSERTIIANLGADERSIAIREIAALIEKEAGGLDREDIARLAIDRENEFGTAIGTGVAIPHIRVDGLNKPIICFARSLNGIDWDAPDGAPVHYVFFLVTPADAPDIHVQTLASIAGSMSLTQNRILLHNASDAAALYKVLKGILAAKPAKLTESKG